MKSIKFLAIAVLFFVSFSSVSANETKSCKTADEVFAYAKQMQSFDAEALKLQMTDLSVSEKVKLINLAIDDVKAVRESGETTKASAGLYILAIFLPPVAVGIHTGWAMPTVWNLVWCCLGGLPGIIHAFIVLGR